MEENESTINANDLSSKKKEAIEALSKYISAAGFFFGENGSPQNKEQAIFFLQKNAENGEVNSQYMLGLSYLEGMGVKKDKDKAIYWLEKFVAQKDTVPEITKNLGGACFLLSKAYFEKSVSPVSVEKGVHWLKKSAECENVFAQLLLGERYRKGDGVEKDKEKAIYWLSKSAEKGNAEAQYCLCLCYFFEGYKSGKLSVTGREKAIEWCQKSASQNNHQAEIFLGVFYYFVEPDYKKSFVFFQKNGDNDISQFMLGKCYYEGKGVPEDKEQAVYWYRLSAENGNKAAQFFVSKCYYYGDGVEQNIKEALFWCDALSESETPKNDEKSKIQKQKVELSLEEKLKAIDSAKTWQEDLMMCIWNSKKRDSDVYKKSHISKQHFAKIRKNKDYSPKKETVLALAIGLELDIFETEKFLADAGYAFSGKNKSDAIVKDFISRKDFNIININRALYENNLPLLGNERNVK